jgi:hypothetical protein
VRGEILRDFENFFSRFFFILNLLSERKTLISMLSKQFLIIANKKSRAMALKSLQKLIFVILVFLQLSKVTTSCTLSNGNTGVCVPLASCVRNQDAVAFSSDFCTHDMTEICCEREKVAAESGSRNQANQYENYESFKKFDSIKCGMLAEGNRISGGQEADLMEFPWSALIGYASLDLIEFNCGGSLINGEGYKLWFR